MRFTTINSKLSIDDENALEKLRKKEGIYPLGISAYIQEESFSRHITLNICPDIEINGFDIWLDLDIYQAELLARKIDQLVSNRMAFLDKKFNEK
ncbi:hypothetical protein [Flavobacterium sp. ACAM 123]|jgi:hypothetical protein|uniref:hypothetical protein n=1 Tax=Flavobacterium sp. ACAM 123 TaxID=1189620 RepID=UPI00036EAE50|nr:hypothetical protein [Flavobacterium sp. ACAM 123]